MTNLTESQIKSVVEEVMTKTMKKSPVGYFQVRQSDFPSVVTEVAKRLMEGKG